jgi:hypothetical protein
MRKRKWWFAGLALALLAACVGVWRFSRPWPSLEFMRECHLISYNVDGYLETIFWCKTPTFIAPGSPMDNELDEEGFTSQGDTRMGLTTDGRWGSGGRGRTEEEFNRYSNDFKFRKNSSILQSEWSHFQKGTSNYDAKLYVINFSEPWERPVAEELYDVLLPAEAQSLLVVRHERQASSLERLQARFFNLRSRPSRPKR